MNVKKAAAIFLALMAALTFLSRALDSFTVIRVKTGYGKQDVIPYAIQGEGELTAGRTVYISLPENMQVEEITARPGQSVKAGDTVLTLQMEGLEEEREALTLEYKKAELTFKQEQMSFAPVPRVTEETLALQQLAAAQRALELGNQDLAKAKEDHEKASIELEHDYVQKKNRTREQVKEDNRKAMKSARRSYESAQKSRDSAVRKAEREVEDKQKKLERLEEQGASEEELERAELELDRAGEDLEDIRDEEDLKVEEARAKMYAAEEDYEDVDYGESNGGSHSSSGGSGSQENTQNNNQGNDQESGNSGSSPDGKDNPDGGAGGSGTEEGSGGGSTDGSGGASGSGSETGSGSTDGSGGASGSETGSGNGSGSTAGGGGASGSETESGSGSTAGGGGVSGSGTGSGSESGSTAGEGNTGGSPAENSTASGDTGSSTPDTGTVISSAKNAGNTGNTGLAGITVTASIERKNIPLVSSPDPQGAAKAIEQALYEKVAVLQELSAQSKSLTDRMSNLMDDTSDSAKYSAEIVDNMDYLIEDLKALNDSLDVYYPDLQTALDDSRELVRRTTDALNNGISTLTIIQNTLKDSSDDFDAAARDSLRGSMELLDKSLNILDSTTAMRQAGRTMKDTIDNELDKFDTDNRFLFMDPSADKVSFTSDRNKPPKTLQIVMRTDEISVDDDTAKTADAEVAKAKESPLRRMWNVLVQMWKAMVSIFKNR